MATCMDDCLYYKVCSDFRGNICDTDLNRFIEYRGTSDGLCEHFKNKADVVEVVRCKDCGMSRETEDERYLFCMQFADTVNCQAFCSYGTPKERGGEK